MPQRAGRTEREQIEIRTFLSSLSLSSRSLSALAELLLVARGNTGDRRAVRRARRARRHARARRICAATSCSDTCLPCWLHLPSHMSSLARLVADLGAIDLASSPARLIRASLDCLRALYPLPGSLLGPCDGAWPRAPFMPFVSSRSPQLTVVRASALRLRLPAARSARPGRSRHVSRSDGVGLLNQHRHRSCSRQHARISPFRRPGDGARSREASRRV